ncbi:hypothetical protein NPIL_144911 [Nephila pilipes]|uniref:Uncharacterized protein n=1 Tax=Nephila pilipes TaxID=299642 RepID=A0A8X6NL21_NEPPI|nr:hypothetical protein NPIL_210561 [Nephila pilipes]GFU14650.1 hypothetical protein NPIL_144911 [Nephila pilipes]
MEILFFRLYSVIFVILLRTAPQRSLESSQDFGHNIPFILCRNLLQLVILKAFFICLLTLLALPDILMSHAKKGKVTGFEDPLFHPSLLRNIRRRGTLAKTSASIKMEDSSWAPVI